MIYSFTLFTKVKALCPIKVANLWILEAVTEKIKELCR